MCMLLARCLSRLQRPTTTTGPPAHANFTKIPPAGLYCPPAISMEPHDILPAPSAFQSYSWWVVRDKTPQCQRLLLLHVLKKAVTRRDDESHCSSRTTTRVFPRLCFLRCTARAVRCSVWMGCPKLPDPRPTISDQRHARQKRNKSSSNPSTADTTLDTSVENSFSRPTTADAFSVRYLSEWAAIPKWLGHSLGKP